MEQRFFIRKCIILMQLMVLICILSGCMKKREIEYYLDTSNYITEEAVVEDIIYEEHEYILFALSQIDDSYQTTHFIIEGDSVETVIKNGIFDKVKIGDEITYTSAPRFFGNGYDMPIVALCVGADEILGFEEGYENLLRNYGVKRIPPVT